MRPLLSIVTPTYQRAHLLERCYRSLRAQSSFDFEWIVVDDGSTDETQRLVSCFSDDRFPITYIKKTNGGKHTALNASHDAIHGEYVLILDSDDSLIETAAELVQQAAGRYGANPEIGVITFLKGASESEPNCVAADEGVPVDIMRYRRTCLRSSDCCEVIRAELFRRYPFPEYEGERFVSECALWNRVSFTHKCVYINRVIYICEYLQDGLTKAGRSMRIRNPRGGMFISELRMDRKNYFSQRVKYAMLYTCYGFFAKLRPVQMAKQCRAKLLMWLCLPFGWLLYQYWKKKY